MKLTTLFVAVAGSFLTACGGGGNGLLDSDTPTSLDQVINASANDDPAGIDAALIAEVNAAFGDANGDPIEINEGDTLADVVARGPRR